MRRFPSAAGHGSLPGIVADSARDGGVVTARCGRVMRRYESVHGALLDDLLCGRPAGHNGPCRSGIAWDRYLREDRARLAVARERARAERAA